jgi:DNA-binding NarL/FixJ family response regulator
MLETIAMRVPTAQIAAEMFVNASTVRNHVVEISRKLGVAGRREIEAAYSPA